MRQAIEPRLFYLVACALWGLLAIGPGAASEMVIVENGQPRATIVVPKNARDPMKQKIQTAAGELQAYVEKISGAKLPIVDDEQDPAGSLILVGRSRLSEAMGLAIPAGVSPSRREEGFVIACKGNRLLLAGNNDGPYHGTEYAVYDFLRSLGVRWFMPGEFGETAPQQKTIRVREQQVVEKPDFVMRNWWLHALPELAAQEARWKLRNKMNPEPMFAMPGEASISEEWLMFANRVAAEVHKEFPQAYIASRYLRAQLEWKAEADVHAILDDFFAKWYGRAAGPMKAFYVALDEAVTRAPIHGHEDRVMPEVYTPELLAQLKQLVAEAEQLADTPRDKLHVRAERLIYEHLAAYMNLAAAEAAADFAAAVAAADRMLSLRGPGGRGAPVEGVPLCAEMTRRCDEVYRLRQHGVTGSSPAVSPVCSCRRPGCVGRPLLACHCCGITFAGTEGHSGPRLRRLFRPLEYPGGPPTESVGCRGAAGESGYADLGGGQAAPPDRRHRSIA